MTRPHLIAKLILAAMGVYLLMHFLGGVSSDVVPLELKCPPETFTARMLVIVVEAVIALVASLILLFRSDGLARMITGPDANQCEKADGRWTIAALRITACFCGLLILYWRIALLIVNVPAIINGPNILSYMTLEGQSSLLSAQTLARILVEVIKGIFAIYLILGAPHYVRRQMRAIAAKSRGEK
jgi:hypothetical protein